MPVTGKVRLTQGKRDNISDAYSSYYSHNNETVKPGYYSLVLDKYKIKVELTATERVGVHKYTFPDGTDNHVIIDLKEGNGGTAYETYIRRIDGYTI